MSLTITVILLQNYTELMELAEKGDNLNIDETEEYVAENPEHMKKSSAGDLYSDWNESPSLRPIFIWGKAVGKNLCKFLIFDI